MSEQPSRRVRTVRRTRRPTFASPLPPGPGGVMEEGMIALAFSAAIAGIDAYVVRVETDSAAGVPHFAIVGLPDRALNESRERVRAALVNSGFGFPPGRLLVNLAPADMRGSNKYRSGRLYCDTGSRPQIATCLY